MKLHIKEDYEDNIEIINNQLSLIPATEEDLDLTIEAELFTTSAAYNTEELPQEVEAEIIQDSKDSLSHTRIILYNEEPIGILQAHELEGYWYIGEIYLKEEYRGQGIGREVLEYEINNHKDMTICLNVYKNNTHAIELYKSLGFEITEDDDDRYIMKLFPKTNERVDIMKLHIKESYELIEAIADIKKYYPKIPDDVFMQLISLDPTYKGNDSAGKYSKWLLNLYNKGSLTDEEFNEVTPLLNQFTTYRNRIQNKDLNSYKSLDDLSNVLASVIDDDSMLTNRQKVRFLKNVKSGKIKTTAEDDYDVVLETPKFIVYVPNTHEASMLLGKGTKWCTAHENPDWYNSYTENGGKLYIIKDKQTGERWQYSDLKGDFLDDADKRFNIPELMYRDEKLSKFFAKFLGSDCYNFDGTWIYNGSKIPEQFKSSITKIIINNGVTSIGEFAFSGCENLESIMIPDSVTSIGWSAFNECASLESVTIPDSVTFIESFAFKECTSLESITIPDSVISIESYTFDECTSLESVTIPDSVTSIGQSAFKGCTNLTSINIPNSVTTIKRYAFMDCENLTSVDIPNSVTEMGTRVFFNCNNLTVYTDNKYVIDYCNENNIPTKPLNNNESVYKHKRHKLHIKESISGRIEDTNERCVMEPTGYWVGANGRRTTSYERIDKEIEYDKNGNPVKRQYSMDRQHRFWIETEDRVREY